MAYLDVWKVEVVGEQIGEPKGDELYFQVNGTKVGPTTSLSTGDSYEFQYDPVYFLNTATVNLYEEDDDNSDDYIATVSFSNNPANEVLKYMDGAGGMYNVYFNVLEIA